MPGGLTHTNIVGCTVFAAVSGSSAATLDHGRQDVDPRTAKTRQYPGADGDRHTGRCAATLGLMIPPSLTLIVYGVTINESITKLFYRRHRTRHRAGADVHGLCRDLLPRFANDYATDAGTRP